MKRISVIGTSGSGKTTFANKLAGILRVPHVELDARTIYRLVTGEECCNGNRERLGQALSRDSIVLWVLQTYKRRRAEYPPLLAALEQRGTKTIRLHSPKEADRWLARLASVGE